MQIRIMLVAGLMLVPTWGAAQTADAPPQLTLDQARAQRSKARDMKAEARKTHDAEIKACQRQAIAIRCISSAKEKREETLKRAEALELEGRTVEREASAPGGRGQGGKARSRGGEAAGQGAGRCRALSQKRGRTGRRARAAAGRGTRQARKQSQQGRGGKGGTRKKAREAETKGRQASRRRGRPGPREGTRSRHSRRSAWRKIDERKREARREGETAQGQAGGSRAGRRPATGRATVKSRRRRHGALPAPARPI
jgi:colicin import membrane protein